MRRIIQIENDELHISDETAYLEEMHKQGKKCVPILNSETEKLDMNAFPFSVEDPDDVSMEEYVKVFHKLAGIPEIIACTERLRIREICIEDLPALFSLYGGPGITDYIEPLFSYEQERDYTENYIHYVYGLYGYGIWILERKCVDPIDGWEIIGRAGVEWKNDRLELGYMIGVPFQKNGYATEACKAILRFAWENTEETQVYSIVDENNVASVGLLKKIGFCPVPDSETKEEPLKCFVIKRPMTG